MDTAPAHRFDDLTALSACSSLLNSQGQYAYYGRVGGCLITGNEDGVFHECR